MPVPNIFGSATSAIPLSQLDQNFATAITLGNTAVYLGNTTTSLGNVTLTNVTISSGDVSVSTATVGAGSNTAPSINTTGDTNTGIFFPAADTIGFTKGGVEAMRINSSGNVGIGAANDAYNLVTANDNTTTGASQYSIGATATLSGTTFSASFLSQLRIAASTTAASAAGLRIVNPSLASGASIGDCYGISIDDITSGTTNDIGIRSLVSSGTNKWNIYASGTAANYFAGQAQFANGSVGTPSISNINDTNTGIYFPAADQVSITTGGTQRIVVDASGNVAIGIATAQGKLHVVDQVDRTSTTGQFTIAGSGYQAAHWLDATAYYIGQNSNSRELRIYSGSSTAVGVRLTAGNNAWQTYSDERMKDIIEPIENAAQKVSTLRTVIGKYKTDEADTRRVFMIAQDVQAVLPEAVTTDAEGMLGMAYDHIVPLLVAAIKEQQAIITQLQADVTALKGTTSSTEGTNNGS